MFYGYFRPFNIICNIFGLIKPIITANGKSLNIQLWLKIWALLVATALISSYIFSINIPFEFNIKKNLEIIPDINDLVVNILIIIINLINADQICIDIHDIFDSILKDLNFEKNTLKLFAYKMYVLFSGLMTIFFVLIILEFTYTYPPYILLVKLPKFLSITNLILHLCLISAVLKIINLQLSKSLMFNEKLSNNYLKEKYGITAVLRYIFCPSLEFFKVDENINSIHFDVLFLSKIYDDLSSCIHLLEKCCGLQILLSIWSMFMSAVVGVTVIVTGQNSIKWLIIVKSVLPFLWCFIGCYINEQLSKEVDQTMTLIIKCLIDYRCVKSRKPALKTFKELVNNDRLQFTACSLFNLNYSMLLGTSLNVITYSIILIQLF